MDGDPILLACNRRPGSRRPAGSSRSSLHAVVSAAGERAQHPFLEFFAANIRNPNTRAAYHRAALGFCSWCERHDVAELARIAPLHVATWVEQQGRAHSAPTVKQQLAAVRMLFDWLVVGQVVPHNPAHAVKGPRHSAAKGKTRMPTREEAKALLAAILSQSGTGLDAGGRRPQSNTGLMNW